MSNSDNGSTILDIEELLNSTLDNVADIPDYVEPDTGLYVLYVAEAELKQAKEKGKASRIVITYGVRDTIETDGIPVANESLFTEGFQGTQDGLGYFKKQAKKLLNTEDLSGIPLADLLEGLKAIPDFHAKVTKKITPATKDKPAYTNLRIDPIPAEAA